MDYQKFGGLKPLLKWLIGWAGHVCRCRVSLALASLRCMLVQPFRSGGLVYDFFFGPLYIYIYLPSNNFFLMNINFFF